MKAVAPPVQDHGVVARPRRAVRRCRAPRAPHRPDDFYVQDEHTRCALTSSAPIRAVVEIGSSRCSPRRRRCAASYTPRSCTEVRNATLASLCGFCGLQCVSRTVAVPELARDIILGNGRDGAGQCCAPSSPEEADRVAGGPRAAPRSPGGASLSSRSSRRTSTLCASRRPRRRAHRAPLRDYAACGTRASPARALSAGGAGIPMPPAPSSIPFAVERADPPLRWASGRTPCSSSSTTSSSEAPAGSRAPSLPARLLRQDGRHLACAHGSHPQPAALLPSCIVHDGRARHAVRSRSASATRRRVHRPARAARATTPSSGAAWRRSRSARRSARRWPSRPPST